jgi:hypothetical protein
MQVVMIRLPSDCGANHVSVVTFTLAVSWSMRWVSHLVRLIMLHSRMSNIVTKVTLIDLSAVEPYASNKLGHVFEEFALLARALTAGADKVPEHYRRVRSGTKIFKAVLLAEADWFYKYVLYWKWNGVQTLESLSDWDQMGLCPSADVWELLDQGMSDELTGWLSVSKVSDAEIAESMASRGLDVV